MYCRRTFEPKEVKASNDLRAKLTEAETMLCKIGPCRERSLALTKLWANAAIAETGVADYEQ
mgnify:CR=1 FL=1